MTRWTMPDIARELDLRVETVHGYRSRQQMPEPTGVIGRTPYWTDAAIGPWIERQKARRKHKGQQGQDAPNSSRGSAVEPRTGAEGTSVTPQPSAGLYGENGPEVLTEAERALCADGARLSGAATPGPWERRTGALLRRVHVAAVAPLITEAAKAEARREYAAELAKRLRGVELRVSRGEG